jgi:hypothetical protein
MHFYRASLHFTHAAIRPQSGFDAKRGVEKNGFKKWHGVCSFFPECVFSRKHRVGEREKVIKE